jgi:hypothetical protein
MKKIPFFGNSLLALLLVITLLLFTTSCTPEIIPIRGGEGIVNLESKSYTLDKEGVVITVVSDAWSYEPIDARYSFTPFLISIRNNTSGDITIYEEHILMFDETNTQYGIIKAEFVDKALGSAQTPPPIIFYGGNYYYRNWGGLGLEFSYPLRYNQYDSKIIPLAFRFGTILSGAKARGFVFMQKHSSESRSLKLVISPVGSIATEGDEIAPAPLSQFIFKFEVTE